MRDVLADLLRWWSAGEPAGLATVTATWSSAPRPPGAAMAVGPDGVAVGSVSGGCVEAAVHDLCLEVAETGRSRVARFGVADELAVGVGLTCGGTVELAVARVDRESFPRLPQLVAAVEAGEPVALVVAGAAGFDVVTAATGDPAARRMLAEGRTGLLPDGRMVVSFGPAPRMLVFGATEHAAAVARIGGFLGYRVTVCDARPVFATARRLPGADEVVVDWPHRYLAAEAEAGRIDGRTVVCVLTHDPKFDVPALELALRLEVGFVGAMGSRRTHEDRLRRLREAGLGEAELGRLSSPIGLDLGARSPEETAVSIAAEIVARRHGGSGAPLSGLSGPVHATHRE
ncbi:xanthine dehydrogenase accessory factor [Actinoplanes teichomyceticus]|uniref:Xanthine dehydrogenase accessory factor n=2 Tax=Actinoplanes teichomyceticus TaxID=1867 RepID=A0A561VSH1_ACTTI|nr:XdhC family protein [Actinoplanes teichomyceticus]TWG14569.1 xanthine dehydrogenase accessory factor [Actinoplanes teichomyceticus]GIF09973.1 xanthine dehydrogenase accessory factor [Actinoplanes teichomyceticus]